MSIVSTDSARPIVFLTRKQQRERWRGISARTLKRWARNPVLGLPPEYDLNGDPCRRLDEIEAWERSRVITLADQRARAPRIERIPASKRNPTRTESKRTRKGRPPTQGAAAE